jgi:ribokinase
MVVRTRGGEGGEWAAHEGRTGTWQAAALPGAPVDSYGAGDSFATGLTLALGAGRSVDDALAYAARCGGMCMTGRGPYGADVSAIGPP